MNPDNTDSQNSPDGSTEVSPDEKKATDSLPDGSESDGTTESDDDTASGGPAD
jgi:hypothetical protein